MASYEEVGPPRQVFNPPPPAPADNRLKLWYISIMKTKKLTEALERVEAWPPHIQNELAEFALELDAGFKNGEYEPTPEELAGIDRGLRAAAEGRFATDSQVEAVFAKFRGK
jgi:predicted transcriptional regulator